MKQVPAAARPPATAHASTDETHSPLSQRFADLAHRAEDGDGEAARTLAVDLGICMRLPQYEQSILFHEAWKRQHPNDASDEQQPVPKAMTRFRDERDRARALCAGISREQVKGRAHWLYTAALAGDAKSAFDFGSGGFLHDDLLGQLEQIPFWREHAEDMLERALAGGESDALSALARGHDPARENDADELELSNDPVAAYAYYAALARSTAGSREMAQTALARLGPELTDAERQRALARADDICMNDLPAFCGTPHPAH
ncbi:MAG TPA: hypothetical protein VJ696_10595 [Rhodanobacteraceae bacterium]|nr:hypothetical protein [Rhodanobacteraceae bacterium]